MALEEHQPGPSAALPHETLYQETGVCPMPTNTLFQLGAERSRRLNRAKHLLPVADAFNYLLAGVPRFEMSLASTTESASEIVSGLTMTRISRPACMA